MNDLILTLLMLLPSVGTLFAIIKVTLKVIGEFDALRHEVKAEGTIIKIDKDNTELKKQLSEFYASTASMYKETIDKVTAVLSKEETINLLMKQVNAQQDNINALMADLEVLTHEQAD